MAKLPEPPLVTAFLPFDFVAHDARTDRHHLIGIFSHILADVYPTVLDGFGVYVNLTNMNGMHDVVLQLLLVIPGEPGTELLAELEHEPIVVADPLERIDFGSRCLLKSASQRPTAVPKSRHSRMSSN